MKTMQERYSHFSNCVVKHTMPLLPDDSRKGIEMLIQHAYYAGASDLLAAFKETGTMEPEIKLAQIKKLHSEIIAFSVKFLIETALKEGGIDLSHLFKGAQDVQP